MKKTMQSVTNYYRIWILLIIFVHTALVSQQNIPTQSVNEIQKPFVVQTSIIGHYLFNLNLKYRLYPHYIVGIKLSAIPRFIWEKGEISSSGGISSTNYKTNKSFFYSDGEVGVILGNTRLFNDGIYIGAYYHGEIGIKYGLNVFIDLEPMYLFGRDPHGSFTGELGFGWNF